MIKKRILFIFILCLCLFVSVVSAETLTGTLGGSQVVSNPYINHQAGEAGYVAPLGALWTNTSQSFYGTTALVRFDQTGQVSTYSANSPSSLSGLAFTLWDTNEQKLIATGEFGYQRYFDSLGVEQPGWQYLIFNSFDMTNLSFMTGSVRYVIHINTTQARWTGAYYSGAASVPVGIGNAWMGSTQYALTGEYIRNVNEATYSTYTFTKPSGLNVQGTVIKTVGGTTYPSKIYIINSTSGLPIASDLLLNTASLSLNTLTDSIKVSMQSPLGVWYNSSDLFSIPIVPTPIPTPTSTYTPLDYTTVAITVKDNSNNSVISNAMVQIKRHDEHNSVDTAYTNSLGVATFQTIMINEYPQQEVVISKQGYQTVNNWLTFTPYSYSQTIYLNAGVVGNEYPDWINVTLFVKSSNGNQPVANAYVAIYDSQAQITGQAGYTNVTGGIQFKNFANTPYIEGYVTSNGYIKKYWNKYPIGEQSKTDYVTTVIIIPTSSQTVVPTPTPTPVTYDTLALTATPDTIFLGQTVSLTGSSSNVTRTTYAGGLRRTVFMVNKHAQAYPFDFKEIGMFENVNATYWKFRSSYSSAWEAPSTASPLTMTNVPDTNGLYTYAFIGYETLAGGSGAIAQAGTDDVTVNGGSGAGSLSMNLFAYDGSNTNHLSNYYMNITDDSSGTVTELGNISYDIVKNLPRGNSYTLRATKENYETGTKTFIVPISPDIENGDFGTFIGVPLFPTGTLSAGNTTVTVHVDDIETYYPLGNVQLIMTYDGSIKYTGSSGESAYWILPQNTAYTVKAIKSGYCAVSESKNTGTNTYQYVPLFMKYGACQGATPTPTPTVTPSVTVTPIWNGTPNTGVIVCNQLPEDATFVDVLKNSLACNGLKDAQSQSLGLACMIILICAIVLGRIAKGIGVLSGVIAGTVLATVAGFLPFWIIIVVVIIAGLVFAGKVFWSNGG